MNIHSSLAPVLLLAFCLLCLAACEKNEYNYYGTQTPSTNTSGSGSTSGSDSGSKGTDDDSTGSDDDDDGDDDLSDDGSAYGDENDDNSGGTIEGILTVAEVLNQNYGFWVTVEGYIVGASSSNTIKSTVYEPPFTATNNIVLADTPYTGEEMDTKTLIQVKLTDKSSKDLRTKVNLKDNPDMHNHKVQISGLTGTYNRRLALTCVWQVQRLD